MTAIKLPKVMTGTSQTHLLHFPPPV